MTEVAIAELNSPTGEPQEQVRIQRPNINIPGELVATAIRQLPAEQGELVNWLYVHGQLEKKSTRQLAEAIGVEATTVYRLLRGTYEAKPDKVCARIASYKELYEKRASLIKLDFVETSTARKIFQTCEWALVSQTINFVYGESQIGKTTALEEYVRRNAAGRVKLIRVPASGGPKIFMEEFASACFLSANCNFEGIRRRVMQAIDKEQLVLVDELQQLFTSYKIANAIKCMELLREIHDRTKCGMVLVGTSVLKREIESGKYAKLFEQLRRRGIVPTQLPSVPPRGDINKIVNAYGLPPAEGDAEVLMMRIIKETGLGKFIKYLQAAGRNAAKQREKLAWKHFIFTHDLLAKLSEGSAL